MAVLPKKRRARRARAHWRGRSGGRDLREHYRQSDLPPQGLAIVEFDDAYGALEPQAQLRPAVRADGSIAEGQPEWTVPERPKIRAIAKQDSLAKMFHRRQLDRPQFQSGRKYQRLYDSTQVALVRSIDWSRTKVSGGQRFDPLNDARARSSRKLRFADDAVLGRFGSEGLSLVRVVLCEGRSVEAVARLRGDRERRHWSWLFRKCLSVLAVQFGFANMTRRPPRPARLHPFNGDGDGIPGTNDAAMHAGAAELADPALRRGRSNGHGQ